MRVRYIETRMMRPSELDPHPLNFRTHPQSQLDALQASIDTVGFARPLEAYLVDGRVRLVDGHGRRELEGDDEVPVVIYDFDEDDARLYMATVDPISALAGQDDERLRALLAEVQAPAGPLADLLDSMAPIGGGAGAPDPGAQIDRAEELREKWRTERGQLWEIGNHRLLCGDSTDAGDVARLMCGERAALAFTSPPYGVGIDYGSFIDTIANVRALIPRLAEMLWCSVGDGGYAVINFGDVVSAKSELGTDEPCEYPMAVEYWPSFRSMGWLLNTRRVWAKPHARVAAPWCASSNRAASDWEHVWTWKRPGAGLNERRAPSYLGVWDTANEHGVDVGKDVHGAGMALGVATWAMEVYSDAANAVLDPFLGTGTTMVAAEQLGRRCFALEIEPKYVAVSLERMAGTGLAPRLAGGA